MIKKFEEFINEDYFSKLASRKDNGNVRKENEITEELVREYGTKTCQNKIKSVKFRKENDKTVVDIDGDFFLLKETEEIPFQFGKVTGIFSCANCTKLKSLKGCPKEVGGTFSCVGCTKLTTLEYCPEKVDGNFDCSYCDKLKSLNGCPKEVGDSFDCIHCEILESLEGCPKKVGGDFYCYGLQKEFSKKYVKSLCDVKGRIDTK